MITILQVSNAFNDAFRSDLREVFVKVWIKGELYTKKEINTLDYDGGSIVGDSFAIGSTFSNSVKIVFPTILEGINELDEVKIEIGIKTKQASSVPNLDELALVDYAKVGKAQLISYVDASYEFVPLGTFFIKSVDPDRNENKTTIEAMDGFVFMGGLYESKLNYPATIRDVALEIANLSGIKVNESDFSRLSSSMISKMEGYTYRQAIGLIAQFEAGYANFDRYGLLTVRSLFDPNYKINTSEYYSKGLKKNELLYRLGGISCKTGDEENGLLIAGAQTGAQISLENKVMTQTRLNEIYSKLENLNFYPGTLNWRGNPAVEVGDWVTMADTKGTLFKMPILTYKMSFAGGLRATISADTKASPQTVTQHKGQLQQTIEWMKDRIAAAGKNNIHSGLDAPLNPKEHDIWFRPNGPDIDLCTWEKIGDNKYDWVPQASTAPNEDLLGAIAEASKKGADAQVAADRAKELAKNALEGYIHITDKTMFDHAVIKEAYIVDGSITNAKIGDLAVNTANIADAAITNAKIGEISANKIISGQIDAANVNIINLNAESITSGKLSAIDIYGVLITGSRIVSESPVPDNNINYNKIVLEEGMLSWEKRPYGGIEAEKFISFYGESFAEQNRLSVDLKRRSSFIIKSAIDDSTLIEFKAKDIFGSSLGSIESTAEIHFKTEPYISSGINGIATFFDLNRTSIELGVDYGGTSKDAMVVIEKEKLLLQSSDNISKSTVDLVDKKITIDSENLDLKGTAVKIGTNNLVMEASSFLIDASKDSKIATYGKLELWGPKELDLFGDTIVIDATWKGTRIKGDLNVTGKKNAIHAIRGMRVVETQAYETAEPHLGDLGESKTDNNCKVKIYVDPIFKDVVNTEVVYKVFLSANSKGQIWVSERNPDYFVVESNTPEASFVWEIKAKRRGYEEDRLVALEMDQHEFEKTFAPKNIQDRIREEESKNYGEDN